MAGGEKIVDGKAGGDRVVPVRDVNAIGNDVSRMCYKLAPNHELVSRIQAEAVAHASVKSRQPSPAFDSEAEILRFLFRNGCH